MKKLKTSIAILILVLMSITGVMKPVTVYAAESYTVRGDTFGRYAKALYVKNSATNEEVVGYCYNAHRNWPQWRPQSLIKYGNASNEQFLKLSSTPRDPKDQLKRKVMEVCYKGFPMDATGVREKYNLSNDVFRFITQSAVWYYTDSLSIQSSGIWYTYNYFMDEPGAWAAYWELVNAEVTLPDNYILDLYENNSSGFQNILSTRLPENYVPPKSIEFSKKAETLGGAELSGATLQVLKKNDGSLIKEWTTDGTTHTVDLFAGEYIFRETTAPNGYVKVSDIYFKVDDNGNVSITSTVNNDIAQGSDKKLTVVDKKIPITYRSLTVTKVWERYGHDEKDIPDSVQVQLYADGAPLGGEVTLKKSEKWSHTWQNLDDSKKYEVKEVTTSNDWVSRIETKSDGNVTIYNSMKPELTVEKIVRDGEWADKTREFVFNIELKGENGNPITDNFTYVIENKDGTKVSEGNLQVQNGSATFKLGHEQKIRIKGLPPKVTYRVEEIRDVNAAFTPTYYTKKVGKQGNPPSVQITNDNPDNKLTVYNDFKYIVDTGIDLNNNYTVTGAFLMIAGSLLFGGIAVLRFRKRLK